jgi:hypothetical protein
MCPDRGFGERRVFEYGSLDSGRKENSRGNYECLEGVIPCHNFSRKTAVM